VKWCIAPKVLDPRRPIREAVSRSGTNFSTVWNNWGVQNAAELRHDALVEP